MPMRKTLEFATDGTIRLENAPEQRPQQFRQQRRQILRKQRFARRPAEQRCQRLAEQRSRLPAKHRFHIGADESDPPRSVVQRQQRAPWLDGADDVDRLVVARDEIDGTVQHRPSRGDANSAPAMPAMSRF